MTVCVAAISGGMVIAASDQMLTAGDIEFEPGVSKGVRLTSSILALTAGDSGFQWEVIQDVYQKVRRRVTDEPENWWHVEDVVELYKTRWHDLKRRAGEKAILAPFGLTTERFVAGRHKLPDSIALQLSQGLLDFQLPGERDGQTMTETIIAGVDPSLGQDVPTAHLYHTWNGYSFCDTKTGFVAIGSGSWHASSQLMLASYNSNMRQEEALWHVYVAKRRAEVAPGVGDKGTDMFTVGTGLGATSDIPSEWMKELAKRYKQLADSERRAKAAAIAGVDKWLNKIKAARAAAQPVQATATSASESSSSATISVSGQT